MATALEELALVVEETKGVEESAIVLLNGIVAQLEQLAAELAQNEVDNTAVLAMAADLKAKNADLAAAVAAVPPTPVP